MMYIRSINISRRVRYTMYAGKLTSAYVFLSIVTVIIVVWFKFVRDYDGIE